MSFGLDRSRPGPRLSVIVAVVVLSAAFFVGTSAPPKAEAATAVTKVAACKVNLRTRASTSARIRKVIKTGTRVSVTAKVVGGHWSSVCAGKRTTGASWYRVSAINGKSVKSLFGVKYLYVASKRLKAVPARTPVQPTPTPTATVTPTGAPRPTAAPTAPLTPPGCGTSLQSLIDATPVGGTLNVPACTYRESVTIRKSLTIDGTGSVIDGRDTAGTVVRHTWMIVSASDVVVDGFTMRYANNASATPALRIADGMSRVTIRDCDLSWAASVAVGYGGANDSTVANCSIHDNGQMGVLLGRDLAGTSHGYRNVLVGNRIYDNRKPAVETGVDGAVKSTLQHNLSIRDNEIYGNAAHAIWLDVNNVDTTISGNRVHHNSGPGIMMEVSSGATITGNTVWNNGFGAASWGWGAGILVASSKGANVHSNTVAWNYAGISVIGQQRPDSPGTTDNYVHDNIVIADQQAAGKDRFGMFWAQDFAGPLYAATSNNRGSGNRFYYPAPENQYARFIWDGYRTLATFASVPGGTGSSYLTTAEAMSAMSAKGIPTTP